MNTTMKTNRLYYLIAAAFTLFTYGCGDDFLDLTPVSNANQEDFFQTREDLEAALFGAYAELQNKGQYGGGNLAEEDAGNFFIMMELRGDDLNGATADQAVAVEQFDFDNFQETSFNSALSVSWSSLYRGINSCNLILDNIGNVQLTDAVSNQLAGEARFIRALSYFNLVRLWGDVPLILTTISIEESRNTVRDPRLDVYAAIVDDLEFGTRNLPSAVDASSFGRATATAARALLGKVYLTLGRYEEAVGVLEEVIQLGSTSLLPNIADVFDPLNEINEEIIFSVRFQEGGLGEGYVGIGQAGSLEYDNLIAVFDTVNDVRYRLLEDLKIFAQPSSTGDFGQDFIVFRYAEVLLMAAEALNEIGYEAGGEAFDLLNQVRLRAGIPGYTATDLPDQASFRDAVLLERRFEFPRENKRWFDLVRTGRAVQTMNARGFNIDENRHLYPIPQREIDTYNDPLNFPQNPGY